jgi:TPR repeat protein
MFNKLVRNPRAIVSIFVCGLILFIGYISISLHLNNVQKRCVAVIKVAKEQESHDEAIALLSLMLQHYKRYPASKQLHAALLDLRSEQELSKAAKARSAISEAMELAKLQANAMQFAAAKSNLSDVIQLFPNAGNVDSAKTFLGQVSSLATEHQHYYKSVTNDFREMHKLIGHACVGDTESQFLLGEAFYTGSDVIINKQMAIHWLAISAEKNHPEAQFLMGIYFEMDEHSTEKAMPYFENAAAAGNIDAMYYCGLFYSSGNGVTKDEAKGLAFLRQSSEAGHSESQLLLAKHLLDLSPNEGYRLLKTCASRGDPEAQLLLFECQHGGKGTKQNAKKALEALCKCVETQNVEICKRIIGCYLGNWGYQRNDEIALEWIGRALEWSSKEADEESSYSSLKKLQTGILISNASKTFSKYNDPEFVDNSDLHRVANQIAHFHLKYPTVSECAVYIAICSKLLKANLSASVRLAVVGSCLIFKNEISMTNNGYHRWGKHWLTDSELEGVLERKSKRAKEVAAYLKKRDREIAGNMNSALSEGKRKNALAQRSSSQQGYTSAREKKYGRSHWTSSPAREAEFNQIMMDNGHGYGDFSSGFGEFNKILGF